ncbi:MAG: response regulator [Planctomycetota bacterium]|jgi:DNA-binding response OmpR family regulator
MEKKILIVDDEAPILDLLEEVFTNEGYKVIKALNAEMALDTLKKQRIQVISLDLMMPGMNGMELCRKIKEQYPLTIVYALTGHISLFGVSDCIEAGFDDVFMKPVDVDDYGRAIEYAFDKLRRWTNR